MVNLLLFILHCYLICCTEPKRSVFLTSWFGTGTKNVKYETIAVNSADENGNLIRRKLNSRRDSNNQIINDCIDIYGTLRVNGEEYERKNGRFKYKCSNGLEIITACKGSNRTGNALIKVNQTLYKDGFWHKCNHNSINETAIYSEETACIVDDKLYHVEEEIRSSFLVMKCSQNGFQIIGCYYVGPNKVKVNIKPGTSIADNDTVHHCEDTNGSIQYFTTALECSINGKKYKEAEEFAANHLLYQCKNGEINIIGCYITDTKQKIKIGDVITKWNMLFKCYLHNNVVQYEEYPCGLPGTQACEIQLNQRSLSSNVPVKPSFGAFSIAQYIYRGNDKVLTGSNTLKLELSRPDG